MNSLPEYIPDSEISAMADKVVEAAQKAIAEERERYQWPGHEMDTYISEIVQLVPVRFDYFTERSPSDLDPMFGSLTFITDALTVDAAGKVGAITAKLTDWDGAARTGFNEGFLDKVDPATQRQLAVAEELRLSLTAYRQILVKSREDIITIGETTIKLLESIEDTDKFGGAFQLGMVGIGIGVAAAINAGPFGLAMATSAGIPSGWSVVLAEFDKPWVEGDASVQETLNSMEDQIVALKGAMAEREEQLAESTQQSQTKMVENDWAFADAMVVPAPSLASYQPGDPIDFTWKGV